MQILLPWCQFHARAIAPGRPGERFPHTQFLGDGEKGELEQGHLRLLRGLGLIQEKQVLSFLCSDRVKAPHTTSSHVDSEPDFFKEKAAS